MIRLGLGGPRRASRGRGRDRGGSDLAETLNRLRSEDFAGAILWLLEDNPRTRRFYKAAGWHADGGAKEETLLETPVRELSYRIALGASR